MEGTESHDSIPSRKNAYEKMVRLGSELFSKTFLIFISIQRDLKISQKFSLRKIVYDEIIFVRSKGAKAQHTLAYVSILLSADSCKKNSSELFLLLVSVGVCLQELILNITWYLLV